MNFSKIKVWIKKNKVEVLVIVLILLISVTIRFYKLDEYMTFLGDEGRDALVVKRILTTWDIPLIGPPTSVGNMYLGPLYYYMMSVPMAVFWLNPVAAAGMVALIGTLTVGLIYFLAREWFGKFAAIISAILYSLSPINITYSKSSWNPNSAPFFVLLSILGFYLSRKTGNYRWLILSGVSLAFLIQMHYLSLIFIPVAGIFWLYELKNYLQNKTKKRKFISGSVIALSCFLILMSPLVIFDFKHNFMNYNALTTFFTQRETTVNLNVFNTLYRVVPIFQNNLIGEYITGKNVLLNYLTTLTIFLPLIWFLINLFRKRVVLWPLFVLSIWLAVGVLGLALYKQSIFAHYLGFLNPVPYLLIGAVTLIPVNKKLTFFFVSILTVLLILASLERFPLKNPPNNQLKRTQEISKFIIEKSDNKPFNFALIAKNNYDSAYQFYLDTFGHKPYLLPAEKTDQLFVVCEDPVCEPVGHPKFEIAAFGWTKIASEENFQGIKVFKLVSNPDQLKNQNK